MSAGTLKLEIPRDFQEFAEELVRRGKAASVEAVVYDTLAARREGIAYDDVPEGLSAIEPGDFGYGDVRSTYMRGGSPGLAERRRMAPRLSGLTGPTRMVMP